MLKKILIILSVVIILAAMVFLYFHNPSEEPFIICMFNYITGLQCPGCGATRALYSLMHLDVISAIKFNLLFTLTVPLLIYVAVRKLMNKKYKINIKYLYLYVIFLVVFTIVRNFL